MNITWLLNVISQLGDKIPAAWPYLIHAAQDIAAIVKILNGGAATAKTMSDDAITARDKLLALGLPSEEVDEVVSAFDAMA